MKLAIVHDQLVCRGGAEQVTLAFHKAFPDAPIYTLAYDSEATYPEFRKCDIRTSWFQRITNDEQWLKKLFFPLGILAMRSLYLADYDVVLISGTHCGKYVRVSANTMVITYCYTPFRLAWNPSSYAEYATSFGIKRIIFDWVVNILRTFDKKYAKRTDYFLAMTLETKQRIIEAYHPKNEVTIINPPVNNFFNYFISDCNKDYYLLVSRLEFYKKVDLAISTFNQLDKKLIIVGKGSKESELKQMANGSNIEFKQNISTDELAMLYSGCKAFIFPQHEDYGLTALEANAAGRPVIAFAKGGVLDTQIFLRDNIKCSTAIFFREQTISSLSEAITIFQAVEQEFDPFFIRNNVENFSEYSFINRIQDFIKQKNSF